MRCDVFFRPLCGTLRNCLDTEAMKPTSEAREGEDGGGVDGVDLVPCGCFTLKFTPNETYGLVFFLGVQFM